MSAQREGLKPLGDAGRERRRRGRRPACGPEELAGAKPPRGGAVVGEARRFPQRAALQLSVKDIGKTKGRTYRFRGGLIRHGRGV